MEKILKLLSENARLTNEQLSVMTEISKGEVDRIIEKYEADGTIRGYKAFIDFEKTDTNLVSALIELKVAPKRNYGFEQIAETIMNFEEVESVYLMSGGFDLAVMVTGKTFKEVALFVSHRLAPLESVMSTATHFVLRKYKDKGFSFCDKERDDRGNISL